MVLTLIRMAEAPVARTSLDTGRRSLPDVPGRDRVLAGGAPVGHSQAAPTGARRQSWLEGRTACLLDVRRDADSGIGAILSQRAP
jgi:hypothetical protein